MPWDVSMVDKHKAGLTPEQKKKWVKIANTTLKGCMKDTKDAKACEASAIKIANAKCVETKRVVK
jgi:hypothetical protein